MAAFDELIMQSQMADLQQEGERLAKEKKEREILLLKARAAGAMSSSALLAKLYGAVEPETIEAPKPKLLKETKNGSDEEAFPPPPTSK